MSLLRIPKCLYSSLRRTETKHNPAMSYNVTTSIPYSLINLQRRDEQDHRYIQTLAGFDDVCQITASM